MRFKCISNHCDVGPEKSEYALAMSNQGSCTGVNSSYRPAQKPKTLFSEVSMWSLYDNCAGSFIPIQVLIKMSDDP